MIDALKLRRSFTGLNENPVRAFVLNGEDIKAAQENPQDASLLHKAAKNAVGIEVKREKQQVSVRIGGDKEANKIVFLNPDNEVTTVSGKQIDIEGFLQEKLNMGKDLFYSIFNEFRKIVNW